MKDLYGRLKNYFTFTKSEIYDLWLIAIFFGFMLSFREWGVDSVSLNAGIYSWVVSSLLVILVVGFYLSVIKCISIWKGYLMTFEKNWLTIGIALFLTFLTEGYLVLLIPGAFYYKVVSKLRVGKKSSGNEYTTFGYIGVVSVLVLVLLIALFIPIESYVAQRIADIAFLLAIFSMLPSPYSSGFYLFTVSYLGFLSMLAFVIIVSILVYLNISLWLSLLLAFIVGLIAWILTYKYLE